MKTISRISLFLVFFAALPIMAFAENYDFKKTADKILSIDAKPGYHVETTRILIIHPLIKDRETSFIHYSKLTWNNNKCTKTVTNFKKLKGKKLKGTTGVGQSFNFKYIPGQLKNFCTSTKVSDWKKANGLKLEKKTYNGYKFNARLKGEKRESILYLSDAGEILAISFGFPESGISHAKNMKEKGTIWHFEKIKGKMALVKITELTTEKQRGIPIIKKSIQKFSSFN